MSTDATVQAICNYTGLDEFGVQELHSSYEQIRMKEKKEEKMILSDEMFWDRVRSIVADGELCRFAAAVQKCENLLFESIYSLESITETELEEATDILQMEDLTKDAEKKSIVTADMNTLKLTKAYQHICGQCLKDTKKSARSLMNRNSFPMLIE